MSYSPLIHALHSYTVPTLPWSIKSNQQQGIMPFKAFNVKHLCRKGWWYLNTIKDEHLTFLLLVGQTYR